MIVKVLDDDIENTVRFAESCQATWVRTYFISYNVSTAMTVSAQCTSNEPRATALTGVPFLSPRSIHSIPTFSLENACFRRLFTSYLTSCNHSNNSTIFRAIHSCPLLP